MHFLLAAPDYEAAPEKYAKMLEVRHKPALFLQGCLLKEIHLSSVHKVTLPIKGKKTHLLIPQFAPFAKHV